MFLSTSSFYLVSVLVSFITSSPPPINYSFSPPFCFSLSIFLPFSFSLCFRFDEQSNEIRKGEIGRFDRRKREKSSRRRKSERDNKGKARARARAHAFIVFITSVGESRVGGYSVTIFEHEIIK